MPRLAVQQQTPRFVAKPKVNCIGIMTVGGGTATPRGFAVLHARHKRLEAGKGQRRAPPGGPKEGKWCAPKVLQEATPTAAERAYCPRGPAGEPREDAHHPTDGSLAQASRPAGTVGSIKSRVTTTPPRVWQHSHVAASPHPRCPAADAEFRDGTPPAWAHTLHRGIAPSA